MFYLVNSPHLRSVAPRFIDSSLVVSAIAKSCTQLFRLCQTLDHLKQIQTQFFVAGLHQDTVANNHLLAFSAGPSFHYAERIFDRIRNPSLFAYNVLIRSLVKRDLFGRAFSLFRRLRTDGLCPDHFTYPFVLKSIGCLELQSEAKMVHGLVVKTGFGLNSYVCNSMIGAYGCLGELASAEKVFEEIPEKVLISWNVLICAYVRREKFEDAVRAFCRMQVECDEKPSEGTIVSLISACTALKDLKLGEEIYRCVGEELGFTANIRNALLDMYVKCGCLAAAQEIFDQMSEKNVIIVTMMVSGYVKCGRLDRAREIFQRYHFSDVVLWTVLINGYVKCGCVDEAMLLFGVMLSRRIRPDKFTVVCLLTGCADIGDLENGKRIHSCIDRHGIEIDGYVATALIDMYAKCDAIDKSLEIFESLSKKTKSDWTSIICGLARNSRELKALELFQEMQQAGIRPDELTFTGMLNACSSAGLVDLGRLYFSSMTQEFDIEPNMEHHKCLIDMFGRAGLLGEARELVEMLTDSDSETRVPLYGALLRACGVNGNSELSDWAAERLKNVKPRDSSVEMLVSDIYGSAERCKDPTISRRKTRKA